VRGFPVRWLQVGYKISLAKLALLSARREGNERDVDP